MSHPAPLQHTVPSLNSPSPAAPPLPDTTKKGTTPREGNLHHIYYPSALLQYGTLDTAAAAACAVVVAAAAAYAAAVACAAAAGTSLAIFRKTDDRMDGWAHGLPWHRPIILWGQQPSSKNPSPPPPACHFSELSDLNLIPFKKLPTVVETFFF